MEEDTNFTIDLTPPTPQEWCVLLNEFEDASIYQTMPFGAVRWGGERLSHLRLYQKGRIASCAQVIIARPPLLPTGIAYLRWGPLHRREGRPVDPAVYRAMLVALHEEYVVRRRLILRVVPYCYLSDDHREAIRDCFAECGFSPSPKPTQYRTLLLDLSPSLEQLRANLERKWRNQLKNAERKGLSVVQGTSDRLFAIFEELYSEMMRRKCFTSTVEVGTFRNMQAALDDDHKMQILICERQGQPVAGTVLAPAGNTGIYLLGATSNEGLSTNGSYLLQWHALSWLKENGYRNYDLGGIDPLLNPGVYHFKAGLAGRDQSFIESYQACGSVASQLVASSCEALRSLYQGVKGSLRRRACASQQDSRA